MRKIEIPTDTTEFELGNTAADIQRQREEREAKEREEEAQKQRGGIQEGGNYTLSRGENEKKACKDRQKRHRNGHREWKRAGISQSYSKHKKRRMINIYLIDEKPIVDFVKDYEELDDKTNKHLKECKEGMLWGELCQ